MKSLILVICCLIITVATHPNIIQKNMLKNSIENIGNSMEEWLKDPNNANVLNTTIEDIQNVENEELPKAEKLKMKAKVLTKFIKYVGNAAIVVDVGNSVMSWFQSTFLDKKKAPASNEQQNSPKQQPHVENGVKNDADNAKIAVTESSNNDKVTQEVVTKSQTVEVSKSSENEKSPKTEELKIKPKTLTKFIKYVANTAVVIDLGASVVSWFQNKFLHKNDNNMKSQLISAEDQPNIENEMAEWLRDPEVLDALQKAITKIQQLENEDLPKLEQFQLKVKHIFEFLKHIVKPTVVVHEGNKIINWFQNSFQKIMKSLESKFAQKISIQNQSIFKKYQFNEEDITTENNNLEEVLEYINDPKNADALKEEVTQIFNEQTKDIPIAESLKASTVNDIFTFLGRLNTVLTVGEKLKKYYDSFNNYVNDKVKEKLQDPKQLEKLVKVSKNIIDTLGIKINDKKQPKRTALNSITDFSYQANPRFLLPVAA